MSTRKIVQMMIVADVAMKIYRAEQAVGYAKDAYHRSINQYEAIYGRLERNVRLTDPAHAAVRQFTAAKYKALQQAKRREYLAKVKLRKACTDLVRLSAAESGRCDQ